MAPSASPTSFFNIAFIAYAASAIIILSIAHLTSAKPISSPGTLAGIAFDTPFDWATRARVQVEAGDLQNADLKNEIITSTTIKSRGQRTTAERGLSSQQQGKKVKKIVKEFVKRQTGPSPLPRTCPFGEYTFTFEWSDETTTYLQAAPNPQSYLRDTPTREDASNISFRRLLPSSEGGTPPSPPSCTLSAVDIVPESVLVLSTDNLQINAVSPTVFMAPEIFYLYQGAQLPIGQIVCGIENSVIDPDSGSQLSCSYEGVPLKFFKAGQSPFLFLGTAPRPVDFPEMPLVAKSVKATRII